MKRPQLPRPDEYGGYWLAARGDPPAILPLLKGPKKGKFMLSTREGVVMEGGAVRAFDDPQQALDYYFRLRGPR